MNPIDQLKQDIARAECDAESMTNKANELLADAKSRIADAKSLKAELATAEAKARVEDADGRAAVKRILGYEPDCLGPKPEHPPQSEGLVNEGLVDADGKKIVDCKYLGNGQFSVTTQSE